MRQIAREIVGEQADTLRKEIMEGEQGRFESTVLREATLCEPVEVYRRHPAVAVESFGARSLALHGESLRLVELNPTAGDLLSRLDGRTPLQEVARSMAEDYRQPPEEVLADVLETVRTMAELGLVERVFPEKEME